MANPDQLDTDGDGTGDVVDPDDDGDGAADVDGRTSPSTTAPSSRTPTRPTTTATGTATTATPMGRAVITVAADALVLWSPEHQYVAVELADLGLAVSDNGVAGLLQATDVVVTRVTADEAEFARGSGDTADDILIGDCRSVSVRAERAGRGNGRVYTFHLAIADPSGNVGRATYEVRVPKSSSKPAVRDGVVNQATSDCQFTDPLADGGTAGRGTGSMPGSAYAAVVAAEAEAAAKAAGAETGEALPERFVLEGAYPNPLSSSATLRFGLPEAADVELVVYDVLGREVVVLVEGELAAGWHEADLDATGLASGTYVARFSTDGGFQQTQRVTVVK